MIYTIFAIIIIAVMLLSIIPAIVFQIVKLCLITKVLYNLQENFDCDEVTSWFEIFPLQIGLVDKVKIVIPIYNLLVLQRFIKNYNSSYQKLYDFCSSAYTDYRENIEKLNKLMNEQEEVEVTNNTLPNTTTQIYFAKTNPEAIIPSKRNEDAGYDIYPCFKDDFVIIEPHTTTMIPTGIASSCSPDYCFILKERGSTGTKGIAQRCGVIDSGFRGSWSVPITNTNDVRLVIVKNSKVNIFKDANYIIYPYEKAIAQALVIPVPKTTITEISYDELSAIKSERQNGMLGSSGK